MQSPITADDIALVQASDLHVEPGLDLLNPDDTLNEDISDWLVDGVVEHNNYRKIHTTCRLVIGRELVWSSQRVRPYMTLSSRVLGLSRRYNVGVYLLTTPERTVGSSSSLFVVEGYDKLLLLDTPYGTSYPATVGDLYLADHIETLLAGEATIVDQTAAADTLPSSRVWPLDEQTTTLRIVNDFHAAINYRGVWVDWDGKFRVEPYVTPEGRAPEWPYSTADERTSIVGIERTVEADTFEVPNKWVFIRNDPNQPFPTGTDGSDGCYVVTNDFDGPTSIEARAGYEKRRIVHLDAATPDSLTAQGDRIVAADKSVARVRTFTTGPNPLHWHWDVMSMVDPEVGGTVNLLGEQWTLPLRGGDMSHRAKEIAA